MPVRSTVFDDAVRSAAQRVRRLWRPMAGWTLLVWAAVATLLVPVSSGVLGRLALRGERIVVGNEELLAWALTPLGFSYLVLAGALAILGALVRYAGFFYLITDDLEDHRASIRRVAFRLAPQLPALFRLCLATTVAGLVIAAPLLAGLAGVYAIFLREFDINYYLLVRPAEWRLALVVGGAWAVVWAVVAAYIVGRGLLAFPAYLDGHRPVRVAVRREWSRTRRSAGRLLRLMAVAVGAWLLLRVAANALVLGAGAAATGWLAAVYPSVRLLVLATGAYLATSFVVDAVIAFLGFAFVTTLLTKFYYEDTDLHADAPPIPSIRAVPRRVLAGIRTWLRPARLLPALAFVLAASLLAARLALHQRPDPVVVAVSAHRAGPPPAPENTLAALERAIRAGADFAEIDVQRTRDGVVVVLHDADLMRVARDPRRLAEADYADLADVVKLPDDGSPPAERRLATLDEFLDRARGRIRLMIELKYYEPDPELAPAVVRRIRARGAEHDVVLMSLHLDALRQLRALAPEMAIGYVAAVSVGDLTRLPVDFLAVAQPLATPRLLASAHRRGIQIHVWTVNEAATMAHLIDRGVDGIITDDPELGVRVRTEVDELPPAARLLLRVR